MKYTKIKSDKQYNKYCNIHEKLTVKNYDTYRDEIEVIEILIQEYEKRTIEFSAQMDPVQTISFLLNENQISKSQLSRDLGVSRQLITDILNYRRSISKSMIIKLAERFMMQQIAFSRPYKLNKMKTKKLRQTA